jgi:hypothetical protein
MAIPSHAEVTKLVNDRLTGDTALMALVGNRIFNHIPQDDPLPCIRFRWEQAGQWDHKDADGFDGSITVDIWTDHRGDKQAQTIADRVEVLLHNQPLSAMTSGQSLLLQHDLIDTFVEPDGLTHHTVARFRAIVTT